jgi:hypothetical protein
MMASPIVTHSSQPQRLPLWYSLVLTFSSSIKLLTRKSKTQSRQRTSRLNRVNILAEFIKVEKAASLSSTQTAVQMRKKATAALLASCGNEMDKYYVVASGDVEVDDDDDDDSDDD